MIFTPEQQRNHVRSLQQALRHFAPELITDGFYGPETTDAVRRFQQEGRIHAGRKRHRDAAQRPQERL